MKTEVITYFVDFEGNFYARQAERFANEARKFGLTTRIYDKGKCSDWRTGTLLKPTVILKHLQKTKVPVLFIDVDSKIHSSPSLVDKLWDDYDMAVVPRPHEPQKTLGYRLHAQLGTLWFNYTNASLEFLKEWQIRCNDVLTLKTAHQHFADTWDCRVQDYTPSIYELPLSYGWMRHRQDHSEITPVLEMGLSKSKSKKETLAAIKDS